MGTSVRTFQESKECGMELFIKVFASVLASLTLFSLFLGGLFMLPVVYLEHWHLPWAWLA
jgi:H+/Cl- antiporter ClcA